MTHQYRQNTPDLLPLREAETVRAITKLLVISLCAFAHSSRAQISTPRPAAPTVTAKQTDTLQRQTKWEPNPKKAGLYAALLPGMGQVYNRQYWKLPIVYGGLTVAGYFIVTNSKEYTNLRQAYVGRISAKNTGTLATDKYVDVYSDDQLKQLQDDANRKLNMTIVYSSLAYALQILDAVTSAHLRNFDVSRDISMHVAPVPTPFGAGVGVALTLR